MVGYEHEVAMHLTLWYIVLDCHQYDVCKNYVGSVYGGLSESGLCVFRKLCPVSFLVVGECTLVLCSCCCCMPSSVNSGCPGTENSILVSSRWACAISSQVTDHWGEPCNRTGEVHPVDPFHNLDNLKNHFASVAFL